ncbi:pre-mRNA-splicing factor CWC22 [Tanacetum coccineum]
MWQKHSLLILHCLLMKGETIMLSEFPASSMFRMLLGDVCTNKDRNGERSDDEDRYRRRRDADRYRSERDGRDRRISNRSDEEDKDGKRDRYRNSDMDRRALIALELTDTPRYKTLQTDSGRLLFVFIADEMANFKLLSPKGLHGQRSLALRKAKFQGHPAVRPELDLVESEDQITHEVSLLDKIDQNLPYRRRGDGARILMNADDDEDESTEEEDEEEMRIRDETETNLVNLRRTIYLTIMSSVDFEEAGHKLLKIKLEPGQEELSEQLGIRS